MGRRQHCKKYGNLAPFLGTEKHERNKRENSPLMLYGLIYVVQFKDDSGLDRSFHLLGIF